MLKDREIEFETINLSAIDKSEIEKRIEEIKQADIKRGFDFEKDTLIRMKYIKIADNEYRLIWCFHHIIMDGWCISLVIKDFINYYELINNGSSDEELLDIVDKEKSNNLKYSDYIRWIEKQDKNKALNYWNQLLDGYEGIATIKPMLQPSEISEEQCGIVEKNLSKEMTNKLTKLAAKANVTINNVLETAWGILLQKYNNVSDVVFGKVVSGRGAELKNIETAVGLFLNTVPIRVNSEQDDTIIDLLRKVKEQGIENSYEYCSLADVQGLTTQGNELIKTLFVFENFYVQEGDLQNKKGSFYIEEAQSRDQTNYAITVRGLINEEELGLQIMYDTSKFVEEEIQEILNLLSYVLIQIIDDSNLKVSELKFITDEQQEKINKFNNTACDYPKNTTIMELFEKQVEKTPNKTAVVFEGESLTFSELNSRANALGEKLRNKGIGRNDFVFIAAERSLEMIEGIYGILKSGAAYVPIDLSYPDERIRYMLEDCKAKEILVYKKDGIEEQIHRMSQLVEEGNFDVEIIDLSEEDIWNGNEENLELINTPDDIVYCIYTSGTTGRPKGVMNCNRGLINRIFWMHSKYPIGKDDAIMQKTTFTFDVSVWEIIWWSLVGARVVMLQPGGEMNPEVIADTILKNNVTTMHFVPSMLNVFLVHLGEDKDRIKKIRSLKYIFCSGEALKAEQVKLFNKIKVEGNLDLELSNFYGPTEASIDVTYYDCNGTEDVIPIGKPISNTKIYIMNKMNMCGIGIPGELCIAGDGVAKGYLNLEKQTKEKFIDNIYGEGKIYRTSDLARWMPDGNIDYIGRIDEQVKIRGLRIELGEVESNLRRVEDVKDAAVIAREDGSGDKALYAYFVSERKIDEEKIKIKLQENMPSYMVPQYIMQIERIPVTKNGKLDRRALPNIEVVSKKEYIEARNEMEKVIVEAYCEVLCLEKVSVKDSFFEIGGHSLKAVKLVNKLEEKIGVRISVKDIFSHSVIEDLAKFINLENKKEQKNIPIAPNKEVYEMSSTQKRVYFMQCMEEGTMYNMPQYIRLYGSVDIKRLKECFEKMVERHEILRTVYFMEGEKALQKICNNVDVDFDVIRNDNKEEEEILSSLVVPFDLSKPNPVRMRIVERDEYNILFLDMHHIVSDGMSMATFIKEFTKLYNGEELTKPARQYKDYSEWMLERDLSDQKKYWMKEYEEEAPVLDIETDYKRPQKQSYKGDNIWLETGKDLGSKIKELCKKTGSTEYMIFLSAAMVLMSKYSRQDDIVIGSPVSGRTHKDTEGMLGMFVNTLAMRGRPEKDKKYSDFLKEIKNKCLEAYENQEYPFEELVESLDVRKDFSRNPLFDVMLTMQNNDVEEFNLKGTKLEYIQEKSKVARFDLSFDIFEDDSDFTISLEYCTDLFKTKSAERMLQHFIRVLEQITENNDILIKEIDTLTKEESNIIFNKFNDTKVEYSKEKTVIELFEEQVEKTPDRIAVECYDEKITYRELNKRANNVAEKLREVGVQKEDFVAMFTERSIEMIVGIYGILKAGGAYVPMDIAYPEDRIKYMLEDCKPKVIVTTGFELPFECDIPVINLKDKNIYKKDAVNKPIISGPKDLAYAIYTSGTTGKPKGVLIEHMGLRNLMVAYTNIYKLKETDVVLQVANYIFDQSVWDIFNILIMGGKLCLISYEDVRNPEAIEKYCNEKKITIASFTPALITELNAKNFRTLRILDSSGEAANLDVLKEWTKYVEVVNTYGPTETTVNASSYYYRGEDLKSIPIGNPIANTKFFVISEGKECGIGVPGELCIYGDSLARGYLNRSELTEEKFCKNPIGEGKIYRTGDLVRWLEDGNIEYMGRMDEQVKIRGYRIELGEIVSVIGKIDGIKNAAVIVRKDYYGEKALYAYLVSDEKISIESIKEKLKEDLPDYMIPAYMTQIDSIPVTRNGKLDRRALPDIEVVSVREFIKPRTKMEEIVSEAYSELLGVNRISVKDSFFEIGGHSLKAVKLVNILEEKAEVRISVREIFKYPVVEKLAAFLEHNSKASYQPIPEAETKDVYEMSSTQKRTYFIQCMEVGTAYNNPLYMKIYGKLNLGLLKESLEKMVERHEILRTVYFMEGEKALQKICNNVDVDFDVIRNDNKEEEEILSSLVVPFDLSKPNPVRMRIVERDEYNILFLDMHHIVSDGMSMATFIKEFTKLYNGEELTKPARQYKDYSEWMLERDLSDQKKYWMKEYEEEAPVLDIETDYKRPQKQSYKGDNIWLETGKDLGSKIKELCKKTGSTEYMIFLSAAMVLMSKYSRQDDIVIGSPVSGRTHKDTEGMLGMFVNTLAMRGRPEKDKKYSDFLKEIKNKCLEAYENQEYPFEELVESLDVRKDFSRNPLFDVMLTMQNNDVEEFNLKGTKLEYIQEKSKVARFDLSFDIFEDDSDFTISLEYCTDLFKTKSAERMLQHFIRVLEQITENNDILIKEIDTLTKEESNIIFNKFNDTKVEYSKEKTVIELFEEQVEKTPDRIAVECYDEKITYRELNKRANNVAEKLREVGVQKEDFVAMFTERSIEMIVGIYGILKAGGAYVPMDIAYPEDRIKYMLEDCKPKVIVTTGFELPFECDIPVINLKDKNIYKKDAVNKPIISGPKDLAYAIYTSGTTGKPKGVLIEHMGLRNLMVAYTNIYKLKETDVVLQVANYIFDQSVWDIFNILIMGGKLCLISYEDVRNPEAIEKYCNEKKITIASFTPALITELNAKNFRTLRILDSSGEAANLDVLKEWTKYVEVVNTYGPTETTVNASSYYYRGEDLKSIPIGNPIANTKFFVISEGKECGIGVPGELCIYGDSLARGYLNRSELTEEKFCKNPIGEGKIYRTGDLVRWLEDGNIEYMGRMDEQVKIRGYRIELGEIVSVIGKIDGIKNAAVIVRKDYYGEKALYAYLVSDEKISIESIKEKLKEDLPDYMIPAYMTQIDSIPVTRNGKLDRRALPEIIISSEEKYRPPTDEIEEGVCEIFTEMLSVNRVGIDDNFFSLGGHSLKVVKLVSKIEEKFNVRIDVKDIFTNATVKQIGDMIKVNNGAKSDLIVKAEEKEYYEMSSVQKRIYLMQMIELGVAYNIPECFKITGDLDVTRIKEAFQELINTHEILRTAFINKNGVLMQKIVDNVMADFEYIEDDISDENELLESLIKPFNMDQPSQIRMRIIKRIDSYLIFIDKHHIVSDGVSDGLILEEIISRYNSKETELPKLQYKDYSEWMANRDLSSQKEYWLNEFNDEIPVLNLPLDYVRPKKQSFKGDIVQFEIEEEISSKISNMAKMLDTTEYVVLLSAAMILLSKHSGQDDILIGSPMSGRTHKDIQNVLGMFVNTIVYRGNPIGSKKYVEFVKEVKDKFIKAYENQEYPLEELLDELNIKRDASRNPLFDVMFVYQHVEDEEIKLGESTLTYVGEESNVAKFDLVFNINQINNKFYVNFEYCIDLFRKETVEIFMKHYVEILKNISEDTNMLISNIDMMSKEEKNKVIYEFNNTEAEYRSGLTIANIFEEQVNNVPNNFALELDGNYITYLELNKKSNNLAINLRNMNIKPNDFVMVIAKKSFEMIEGILAVLKAGAAYVPVDINYPDERISYIINDCKPKVILVYDEDNKGIITRINDVAKDISYDNPIMDLRDKKLFEGEGNNLTNINKSSDLAYLIYTSGTTGKPKGVMVEHEGVLNLRQYFIDKHGIDSEDRVLQFASCSFDAMVSEISMSILCGATLHLLTDKVQKDIELFEAFMLDSKITRAILPPQYLAQVKVDGLKTIITAGSETNNDLVIKNKNIPVYSNDYGPTEVTVCATYWKHDSNDEVPNKVPIGRPINNKKVYIMRDGNPCGIGVPGELCVGGVGIARGYLNMPELTSNKFTNNKFGKGRLYHTGDYGRWLPDGNIVFMGRKDDQVKIRGYRIELGEVENAIRRIPVIKDVALIISEDKGNKFISSFVVADEKLEISSVRTELKNMVPNYMVPARIIQIDAIPITRNGKVDNKALRNIDIKNIEDTTFKAATNENEKMICELFAEILGVSNISIDDNFFDLGGDSIRAMKLVYELRAKMFVVSINDILKYQSVREISKNIVKENKVDISTNEGYPVFNNVSEVKQYLEEMKVDFSNSILGGKVIKAYDISILQENIINSGSHISGTTVEFENDLDMNVLNKTITSLVNSQGLLRTVLINKDNKLSFYEYEKVENLKIPFIDLSNMNDSDKEKVRFYIENDLYMENKVYDEKTLGRLLYQVIAVRYAKNNLIVYIPASHLIFDGMSGDIMRNEVKKAYHNNGVIIDENRDDYSEYIYQINKGPVNVSDNELVKELQLDSLSECSKNFKNINTEEYRDVEFEFNISNINEVNNEEGRLELSTKLFIKLMELNFNCKNVAYNLVTTARNYEERNFNNTIGEMFDIVPFVGSSEKATSYTEIKERIEFMRNNNIHYMSLLYDEHDNSKCYCEYLKNIKEAIIPTLNYLGIYDEERSVCKEEDKVIDKKCSFSCEVSFRANKLILNAFCKEDDLEEVRDKLQKFLDK